MLASKPELPPLHEVVQRLRSAPAWQRKRELQVVARGPLRVSAEVGDDAVAIPDGDGYLLLAAEVIWPPLLAAEPELAGRNAVLTNANDIYAMGGRPVALLDTVLASGVPEAEAILRGLAAGAARYGIPVVGGHLTANADTASLAAFVLGRARRLLSGRAAVPGDALLLLTGPRGRFHPRFPFWDCSSDRSDADLRADLELLPVLAERGLCDAARDVSMPGLLGSALQFLEGSGVGAEIDCAALPVPPEARGREVEWLLAFPSYAFLLAVAEAQVAAVVRLAADRERLCVRIGRVIAERRVTLVHGADRALLWDFAVEPFSGFGL
ncbi:MAG TPA: AIR synthase related protein [Chloroflexota bacterium]